MTYGGNVNYYKSVHHSIPNGGNREHPDNFQSKTNLSIECLGIFSSWPN